MSESAKTCQTSSIFILLEPHDEFRFERITQLLVFNELSIFHSLGDRQRWILDALSLRVVVYLKTTANVGAKLGPWHLDLGIGREGQEVTASQTERDYVLLRVLAHPGVGQRVLERPQHGGSHDGRESWREKELKMRPGN